MQTWFKQLDIASFLYQIHIIHENVQLPAAVQCSESLLSVYLYLFTDISVQSFGPSSKRQSFRHTLSKNQEE